MFEERSCWPEDFNFGFLVIKFGIQILIRIHKKAWICAWIQFTEYGSETLLVDTSVFRNL
jgi:hypothetical protein